MLLMTSAAVAADLEIRVLDERGRPVWARLEVRGPGDKMYQPASGAILDTTARNREGGKPYYLGSFVVNSECKVEVPAGRYTVVAERGPEYERVERSVGVAAGTPAKLELKLRPWIRMRDLGWWSGDMHVHRPVEDSPSLSLAEDLNVNVVFTMWNKRSLWDSRPLPADPVLRASPDHLVTVMNAEDERGGGAWMLHHLREPLKLAVDGRWFPAGILFVNQARAMKPAGGLFPWFDCEKPIWWEVPVMVALATPDSFGALHNHFNQYGIHASEAWGKPRDIARFPGSEGFVQYVLSLYYRYLNLGFRMPPSAGSASGVLPNPVGYNRLYASIDGPFSLEAWYRSVREGRCFVTNGPMLFFRAKQSGSVTTAIVDVRSREPIERVEILANGAVIHVFPTAAAAKRFQGEHTFDSSSYTWMAARCFVKAEDTIRLAHSAPIDLRGKHDARDDARYFIDWIDELIALSEKEQDRFASSAEKSEVVGLYRRARAVYEEKSR